MRCRNLILATALLSIAAPHAQAQDAAPAPKVSIAAAYMQDIVEESAFIGKVEAVDAADLLARVEGFLEEVVASDGAIVSQGDPLFRIESDQYDANLDMSEADLARAEANLKLAQIELDRKQQLVEREAVPQSELDIARANEAVAEADILSAKAAIAQAKLDVSYTTVIAPFDGRIGRIDVSTGDLIGPQSGALANIVRESPIYVTFSLGENQFIDILEQIGVEGRDSAAEVGVRVELPNGRELDEVGTIAFADNRVDPATGSISVRAEFENSSLLLIDGSFVQVNIEANEAVAKLMIPQAAVQRDQKGDFVLVVGQEQTVEQRYVTLGEQVETAVVVEDGLREGESVIVEGLQRVRPGVPVDAIVAGTSEEG